MVLAIYGHFAGLEAHTFSLPKALNILTLSLFVSKMVYIIYRRTIHEIYRTLLLLHFTFGATLVAYLINSFHTSSFV